MLWMIPFALRQCFPLSHPTPGCSSAPALQKDILLIYGVLCSEAPEATIFLQLPWVCCAVPCWLCSCCCSVALSKAGPRAHPRGVRTAQQGVREGRAGFGAGSLQGLPQEGKFPISYLAPPSHPHRSAHFLKEDLFSLQTTEPFSSSSSSPCSSIPCAVCFPVLPLVCSI